MRIALSICTAAVWLGAASSFGQTTNCVPRPPGLISWWRGEGNGLDSVGFNHGTVFGAGGFTNALVRRGFFFSGNGDDYVALPPNLFPVPGLGGASQAAFSFEAWFSTTAGGVILGQQDEPPFDFAISGNVPGLYVGTNGFLYAQMFWGGSDSLPSSTPVNDGQFHHVAVTFDGGTEMLFLDGVPVSSQTFAQQGYAGTYYYQFGTGWTDGWANSPGGWFPFSGILDEPSFYFRALTPTEVASIYHAGGAGKCAPPDGPLLVHRYSFNEAAGTTVAADAISGNNGVLLNFTTNAPYTNGTPDGSGFTGNGRLSLKGNGGYVSLPPRLISWLSNATFEAWMTWNGPSTSVWQRVWDFGFSDAGTNTSGIGTNYVIFSPNRGGTEMLGFEETTINPFGSETDPKSLILYGKNKMPVGEPVYIAVTYDPLAGESRLYLNAQLISSTNRPLNQMRYFTDFNNWLGRSQWSRDPTFNGEYDEFRIWDGILSPQDIASHYATGPNQQFITFHPLLFLGVRGTNAVLSWYTNYADGFQLERAPKPAPAAWQPVTNAVIITNGTYQVKIPMAPDASFYRLKR